MITVMTVSLRDHLAESARTGEVLRIIYHGGSQPGSLREIVPLAVIDDELDAKDLATGIRKTFKIEKIDIAPPRSSAPQYDPTIQPVSETFIPLDVLFADHVERLRAFGWHIQTSAHDVSLHRKAKRGDCVLKTPTVQIWYVELTADVYVEDDGRVVTEERPSQSPYHVSSPRMPTRSYRKASSAVDQFLIEAKELSPTPSP